MPIAAQTRMEAVRTAMAKVPHLATLPEIALRAIKLAADPESTADQMAGLVSHAPELCTRIL
ncbi:MAG: hypothetical protein HYS05_17300, partial [Acidobacteria bacterium]|nr:hypothetical protein [Acidobacteriota bacterium]